MSALATIFKNAGEKSPENEKLLHLYWNRAELKKQFARTRKQQYKLEDKIKQQEGKAARLQQKLDHLEQLLLDPDAAPNVMTFYQLRGLALHCEAKLSKFAEQLKQQREQRQHNAVLVRWNDERTRQSKAIEQEILAVQRNAQRVRDRMQTERERLLEMSGFLKVFRRRSVSNLLDRLGEEVNEVQQQEQALIQKLEELKHRKPPDNQGLNVGSKRSINLMILSFAQQLLLLFRDDQLASMAKEASEKSVGAINYGGRLECEQLLAKISKKRKGIDGSMCSSDVLQARAKLLAEQALYRNDSDAVPVAGSVSTLFDIEENGAVRKNELNLLGENFWNIARIFSR